MLGLHDAEICCRVYTLVEQLPDVDCLIYAAMWARCPPQTGHNLPAQQLLAPCIYKTGVLLQAGTAVTAQQPCPAEACLGQHAHPCLHC